MEQSPGNAASIIPGSFWKYAQWLHVTPVGGMVDFFMSSVRGNRRPVVAKHHYG